MLKLKGIGLLGMLIVLVIHLILGGILWPYTINSWSAFFGKDIMMSFWQGAILGVIPGIGSFSLLAAAITFVILGML